MSAYLGLEVPRQDDAATPAVDESGTPIRVPSSDLRPARRRRPATEQPNPFVVPDNQPCAENKTLVQGFEWYVPADSQHWRRLTKALPSLAALGVTGMWIPPACKASWPTGNGYDIYDLYDLGEFDQKGARHTKWGTKEELVQMVDTANAQGVGILFDTVLNHKAAADFSERAVATKMDPHDRTKVVGEPREIEAWTGYKFPGRGSTYSPLKWNKSHFTGIDYDALSGEKGVFKFVGKEFSADVDEELGNYDYLMFADIDHRHPEVRRDLFDWTNWLSKQLKLGGMRLDAIKHYSFEFLRDLVAHIDRTVDPGWFLVGEYWREDSEFLSRFIEFMNCRISLFDVQLVSNFSCVSLQGDKGDLTTLFDDALVMWKPANTVTFVVNHDTQLGQSLETPVAPFFIPLAYSMILLRANAGIPCVFYSDLFGSIGQHPRDDHSNFVPPTSGGAVLPKMMLARNLWAYGTQFDYFDDPHCVGFTRTGHPSLSGGHGLAVVVTNSWEFASKPMYVGRQHAGEVWTDLLKWCPGVVKISSNGWGEFPVAHRSVSVWVNLKAPGRQMVDSFVFDSDIYGYKAEKDVA
ncbi:alpha-amylase-like protein [Podospora appendiculata]|uniref:Alpha-amylase-like protein n=1 Tax=Podospora appendiculata TaxID=314037 RepID=A0AAE0XAV6_9PEZI|nr:alpha-amylase-like protein [Podospora appendiculata]